MFPQQLASFRESLNERLWLRLTQLYIDPFFSNEIMLRIEKGRKIRSWLFMTGIRHLGATVLDQTSTDVCLAIEMCHAASVLVDDILDGDDMRHGDKSSHAHLGTPMASLQSHYLCAEAINLLSSLPDVQTRLIATYQRLTLGEMYDVFMPKPHKQWIYAGYDEKTYQKTSALFEFSLAAAALVSDRKQLVPALLRLGTSIGQLYQVSNDYYDLQPHNVEKRHSQDESWRVTFSLPIALYLQRHGRVGIEKELESVHLTRYEWMQFLTKIWTTEVKTAARSALKEAEMNVRTALLSVPDPLQAQINQLLNVITHEDFWYHPYDAAA